MRTKIIRNVRIIPNAISSSEDGVIYVASSNCDLISKIIYNDEKQMYEAHLLGTDSVSLKKQMYSRVIDDKDEVFFIPYNSDSLVVYNKIEGVVNHYDFDESITGNQSKFLFSIVAKDGLWLFGTGISKVLVFDIRKKTIIEMDDICKGINKALESDKWEIYDGCYYNDHLYLVTKRRNMVVDVDLNKLNVKPVQLGQDGAGFMSIVLNEKKCFLSPNGLNKFVTLDLTSLCNRDLGVNGESDDWSYYCNVKKGKYIYYFPYNGCKVIRLNVENEIFEELDGFDDYLCNNSLKALSATSINDKIIIAIENSYKFLLFDVNENKCDSFVPILKECSFMYDEAEIVKEEIDMTFDNFIEFIL